MTLQIVRPPTLLNVVVDAIRSQIYAGEIKPGEPLREMTMSEAMEVSRNTVREALKQLEEEGLVEAFPHRGAYVKRLSPHMSWEIYTLRALLEPFALRTVLEEGTYPPEDLQELASLVQTMGELERNGDDYGTIKADMGFHRVIYRRSKHELLNRTLDNLQSVNLMFMLNTKLYRSEKTSNEQSHRLILEAITSGDLLHAEAIIRDHIHEAGISLMQRMEAVDWDQVNH